jgi:hypothetical protein
MPQDASIPSINDLEKTLISIGIVPGRVKVNSIKGHTYIGIITKEEFDKRNRENLSRTKQHTLVDSSSIN